MLQNPSGRRRTDEARAVAGWLAAGPSCSLPRWWKRPVSGWKAPTWRACWKRWSSRTARRWSRPWRRRDGAFWR